MKSTFALVATSILLTSCASTSSGCISKGEAAKNYVKFDTDEIAHAYASIPNYKDKRNHFGDSEKAIRQSTEAIETFELSPKQESWFVKKRLSIHEAISDKDGARADIERLKYLGTLYPGEAEYLNRRLDSLDSSPDEANDRDAQPLIRFPPIMSKEALRGKQSGHCVVTFDVSKIGVPENIRIDYCTSEIFRESSITAVSKWKYNPAIRNKVAVPRKNVETKIRYAIFDACGTQFPE